MAIDYADIIRDELAWDKKAIEDLEKRINWQGFLVVYHTKGFQEAHDFLDGEIDDAIEQMAAERQADQLESEDDSVEKWLDNVERARAINEVWK